MIETTMTKELLDKLMDFESFLGFTTEFLESESDPKLFRAALLKTSVESYLEGRRLLIDLLEPILVGAAVRIKDDLSWTVSREDIVENMQKDSGFDKDLKDLLNGAGISG